MLGVLSKPTYERQQLGGCYRDGHVYLIRINPNHHSWSPFLSPLSQQIALHLTRVLGPKGLIPQILLCYKTLSLTAWKFVSEIYTSKHCGCTLVPASRSKCAFCSCDDCVNNPRCRHQICLHIFVHKMYQHTQLTHRHQTACEVHYVIFQMDVHRKASYSDGDDEICLLRSYATCLCFLVHGLCRVTLCSGGIQCATELTWFPSLLGRAISLHICTEMTLTYRAGSRFNCIKRFISSLHKVPFRTRVTDHQMYCRIQKRQMSSSPSE